MENYIVSARKYRPSTFESVVGQRALTETLRNAIRSGHLAHAYLFCGPRGVGKTTCARIFAKTINCLQPTADHDACNDCESCRSFNEGRSFNIHELDAASNNSVEDIRQLIQEVRIPPQVGKYSVYIIDEVHMLSQGAFNALLKTLEEPPSYAIFILATTEKHKVLPTILSRCQVYDFSRITVADTIAHLRYVATQEGVTASDEVLNVIAQKADGGMRDALSIFDQLVSFAGTDISYERAIEVLNVLDTDYYFRLVDDALAGNVSDSLLLLNEVLCKGFDAGHFVTGFMEHLRDLLVTKDPATAILLETSDAIRLHYTQQAQKCSPLWIFKALDVMNQCDINYRTARNKRLTVELALVKLTQLLSAPAAAPAAPQPVPAAAPAPQPAAQRPAAAPQAAPSTPSIPSTPSTPSTPSKTSTPSTSSKTNTPSTPIPATPGAMPGLGGLPSLGGLPTIPSINTTPSAAQPQTQQAQQSTVSEQHRPFTVDQFNSAWAGLSKHFEKEERLKAMLTRFTPRPKDETTYVLTLANPWQAEDFKKFGKQVADIIRAALQNTDFKLLLEVGEYEHETKAYTAEDKYQLLLEMNSELANLKQTLALQLE